MSARLWRYHARALWQGWRDRGRAAPPPRLSVAIIAQDCQQALSGLIDNISDIAWEIVVVDGGSKDGTRELCSSQPKVRLIDAPWPGDFAIQKNRAFEACRGEWILHLDTDERIGPELKARLPALCAASVPGYRLPMYWLIDESPARYVLSDKHFPCFCPRLFRNDPKFRYIEGEPVHVRFPEALIRSMKKVYGAHLFHYCFLWLSREQLEAKAERYREQHPSAAETTARYYEYWKFPHSIEICREQPDTREEEKAEKDGGK